jgi:hypothetical protein
MIEERQSGPGGDRAQYRRDDAFLVAAGERQVGRDDPGAGSFGHELDGLTARRVGMIGNQHLVPRLECE